MVKLVYTRDLKSLDQEWLYGFDPRSEYKLIAILNREGKRRVMKVSMLKAAGKYGAY